MPFLAVGDWITKGAAQRGRAEGAVLPARRSAPEHDPCMTSEHSTTAWWNRPGVNFEEGEKLEYPEKNPWSQIEIDWIIINQIAFATQQASFQFCRSELYFCH